MRARASGGAMGMDDRAGRVRYLVRQEAASGLSIHRVHIGHKLAVTKCDTGTRRSRSATPTNEVPGEKRVIHAHGDTAGPGTTPQARPHLQQIRNVPISPPDAGEIVGQALHRLEVQVLEALAM